MSTPHVDLWFVFYKKMGASFALNFLCVLFVRAMVIIFCYELKYSFCKDDCGHSKCWCVNSVVVFFWFYASNLCVPGRSCYTTTVDVFWLHNESQDIPLLLVCRDLGNKIAAVRVKLYNIAAISDNGYNYLMPCLFMFRKHANQPLRALFFTT